jgi:group I intron endonuclease
LLKYGYSKFKLEILKYCSPAKCIKWEQYYFDLFNPEYNILKIAGSSLGSNQSEESRAKISASMKGIPKSDEAKAKMSASQLGNTNAKNQPNSVKIEVLDLDTDKTTIYPSANAAAKALNISQPAITMYFKRNERKPLKGRYILSKI